MIPTSKTSTTPSTTPTIPPAGIAGPEVVTWEAPLTPPLVDTEADGLGSDECESVEVESGELDGRLSVKEVLESESEDSGRVELVEIVSAVEDGLPIIEVEGIWLSVIEVAIVRVSVIVTGPGMLSTSSAVMRFPWRARAAEERR